MITKKLIKSMVGTIGAAVMIGALFSGCTANDAREAHPAAPATTAPVPPQQSLPPGAGSAVPSNDTSVDPESPGPAMDSDEPAPTGPTDPIPTTDNRTPIAKPGKKGVPRGLTLKIIKIRHVDRKDADDVTTAFGLLFGAYDTKIDNSMNDAGSRAASLATPALAKSLRTDTSVVGPDAIWTTLADHHGYTTLTTRLGGVGPGVPDTDTRAVRVITLYIQRHGDHGWKPAPDDPEHLLITLHRSGPKEPWAVSKFQFI